MINYETLLPLYSMGEARAIVRTLLMDAFGLSYTDICAGEVERFSEEQKAKLDEMMQRLANGEPVQYVTGKAMFCDRFFHVETGCLIPRPETEELCRWIIEDSEERNRNVNCAKQESTKQKISILDIGTGSGCIAITLALDIPNVEVTAWDISNNALRIAKGNATDLGANVSFEKHDALNLENHITNTLPTGEGWAFIVSNPPYICNKEAVDMEHNVLDHEPHLALFVPDEDPLLFYREIAKYAFHALEDNGALYYEINPLYVNELTEMLHNIGFQKIEVREDEFGKQRMMKCTPYIDRR